MEVPFFRPDIGQPEIDEVTETLRSGWLTSGPRVKRFEADFARAVGAPHAIAVNSATAALHLAVEALGVQPGETVLVPTMTFAATAEVVRYLGAFPLLVDCDPETLNLDLEDAARKIDDLRAGRLPGSLPRESRIAGVIPVHVGGLMVDVSEIDSWARARGMWVVEDAAHSFPAAWRPSSAEPWRRCGDGPSAVTCFSFYANKTMTTGEGGMAVTGEKSLAERIRMMSLHGLSGDAWTRFSATGSWDYQILAPGYKYNLTDVAAAIGIHQLARAEEMRRKREEIARVYREELEGVEEIDLPADSTDRVHAWHLFPIRLRLEKLSIDRNEFLRELRAAGIGHSVHWRPLHLHAYYAEGFGWRPEHLPAASRVWERLVSLPIFPAMRPDEIREVVRVVTGLCRRQRSVSAAATGTGR